MMPDNPILPEFDPTFDPPTPDPESTAGAAPSLDEQLAAALAERDENHDRFLRAQAEMDNVRKRLQRERDEERRYASLPIVRDLLPVMDNLQRAIDAARGSENVADLTQGVDMVLRQMQGLLAAHGAETITALGEPFDANRHEALQQTPTNEHPPMTVVQELERGYTLHDRVIRPSKVIVAAPAP